MIDHTTFFGDGPRTFRLTGVPQNSVVLKPFRGVRNAVPCTGMLRSSNSCRLCPCHLTPQAETRDS